MINNNLTPLLEQDIIPNPSAPSHILWVWGDRNIGDTDLDEIWHPEEGDSSTIGVIRHRVQHPSNLFGWQSWSIVTIMRGTSHSGYQNALIILGRLDNGVRVVVEIEEYGRNPLQIDQVSNEGAIVLALRHNSYLRFISYLGNRQHLIPPSVSTLPFQQHYQRILMNQGFGIEETPAIFMTLSGLFCPL